MLNFLLKLLISGLTVLLASMLLPGVTVDGFMSAVIVAAFLALLNATLKPLLVILTIPITLLTLGLFLLVINAVMILLADAILPGFEVAGFWWALLFSIILSLFTSVFDTLTSR